MADAESHPQSALTPDNPWPGVFAFNERDQPFFHGRKADSESLLAQVRRCEAVVLYGLSGLGKTSLLQAGLFPALRAADLLPVRIRIGFETDDGSVTVQVMNALRAEFDRHQIGASPWDGVQSLWEYFHRTDLEFWSPRNRRVSPVLVFDQFEEVFTKGQRDAETRRRVDEIESILVELLEHRPPDAVRERLDADPRSGSQFDLGRSVAKVVVSLREDFLPQLDSWRVRIPSLLSRRQRLEEMTEEQGLEVILGPGGHLVDEDVARRILVLSNDSERQRATGRAVGAREIEPTLLSLVCERLNGERLRRQLPKITPELVDEIGEKIVTHFYESAFAGLTAGVRAWVENSLVTSAGFRQSVELSDVPADRQAELQTLIERHLLHREERKGGYWVELTHDRLTDPARHSRDARMAQEGSRNLVTAAKQTATALRTELARPSEGGVEAALHAVSELERSLANGTAVELGSWWFLCNALAAEICAADARFDEAQQLAQKAMTGLDGLGAPDGAEDPSNASVLVARAQTQFVLGVIALETGDHPQSATWLQQALATVGSLPEFPSLASDMAREAARLNVEVRLRLAALAEHAYDMGTVRSLCEEVLAIGSGTGGEEFTVDELAGWSVQAWLVLARSQSHEPSHRRDWWLSQAERRLEEQLKVDAGNVRWSSLYLELLAQWSEQKSSSDVTWAIAKLHQAAKTVAGLPDWFRDGPRGSLSAADAEIARAQLLIGQKNLAAAEEALDRAGSTLRALAALRPGWLAYQREAAWLSWKTADFLNGRIVNAPGKPSSEDVEAVISAYSETTTRYRELAVRVPASLNRRRAVAVCLGAWAAAEQLVPRPEAARSRYHEALAILGALPPPASRAADIQGPIGYYNMALADLAAAREDRSEEIAALGEAIRATLVVADVSPEPKEHFQEAARLHRLAGDRQQRLKAPDKADEEFGAADALLARAETSVARKWMGQVAAEAGPDATPEILARIASGAGWEHDHPPDTSLAPSQWRDEEVPLLLERIELLRARAIGLAPQGPARTLVPLTMACRLALGAWELSRTDKVSAQIEALEREIEPLIEALEPEGADEALRLRQLKARLSATIQLDVDEVEGRMSSQKGIRVPSRPQNWVLPALIPGPWRTLAPADHQLELRRTDPVLARLLIPERCLRIRTMSPDCYEGASLFEAEVATDEGKSGTSLVVYLRRGNAVSLLDGKSAPFHDLNGAGALRLDSPDRFVEYLSLFVNGIQGDDGRFAIIHTLDELSWEPETPVSLRQDVRKLIRPLVALADTDGGWTATGTVNFGDALFYARFQVSALGMVEMSSDEPCATMLPIRVDEFADSVRAILPRQTLRSRRNLAIRTTDWGTASIAAQQWFDALVEGGRSRDTLNEQYRTLILIQLAAGHASDALRTANIALESTDERPPFLAARGHALLFLGRTAEAEAAYLKDGEDSEKATLRAVGKEALKDWEWLQQMADVSHPEMPRLRDLLLQARPN